MLNAEDQIRIAFYEKRIQRLSMIAIVALAAAGIGYVINDAMEADLGYLIAVPGLIGLLAGGYAMVCFRNLAMIGQRR